jgi:hypothetical protein
MHRLASSVSGMRNTPLRRVNPTACHPRPCPQPSSWCQTQSPGRCRHWDPQGQKVGCTMEQSPSASDRDSATRTCSSFDRDVTLAAIVCASTPLKSHCGSTYKTSHAPTIKNNLITAPQKLNFLSNKLVKSLIPATAHCNLPPFQSHHHTHTTHVNEHKFPKIPKIPQNSPKFSKTPQNSPKFFKISPHSPKFSKILPLHITICKRKSSYMQPPFSDFDHMGY